MLPVGFGDNEYAKSALQRRRAIQTPSALLRLCLAYGVCDMSLRQTAVWAAAVGLGDLSNVAVLKRLRKSADWLGYILAQWLKERGLAQVKSGRSVRLVDATLVRTPGLKALDYRVHLSFRLDPFQIQSIELTDVKGSENFARYTCKPGEIVVADRGYAYPAGVASILRQKANVVARMHWRGLPLFGDKGGRLDVLTLLGTLEEHECGDWAVNLHSGDESFPVRLVAVKKSRDAAKCEQNWLRKHAVKQGRGLDPRSLAAAQYFYVVTDLPRKEFSTTEVMELYRMRWQIELVFKRMKSLLKLDDLRAKDPQLARAYLYSKLLGALIVEELAQAAVSFFPWGYPLAVPSAEHLASARPVGAVFAHDGEGDNDI